MWEVLGIPGQPWETLGMVSWTSWVCIPGFRALKDSDTVEVLRANMVGKNQKTLDLFGLNCVSRFSREGMGKPTFPTLEPYL